MRRPSSSTRLRFEPRLRRFRVARPEPGPAVICPELGANCGSWFKAVSSVGLELFWNSFGWTVTIGLSAT